MVEVVKASKGSAGMGSGNHRNGLLDYLRYHPPGVIFLLCLLSFAVSTCVLTLYVGPGASVRNPGNTCRCVGYKFS